MLVRMVARVSEVGSVIKILIAPQSICALTRCMLPCIFSTMVGFVVSAATSSALPVCLSAFVDFL